MVRAPCCDKHGVRKGAWTPEEDKALVQYTKKHGHGSWRTVPKEADEAVCQSPVSQASSSTKLESCSDVSLQVKDNAACAFTNMIQEQTHCKPKRQEGILRSESGSCDSDSELKYLLDVPDGDIGFLEGQTDSS